MVGVDVFVGLGVIVGVGVGVTDAPQATSKSTLM
jgi:hypothetical protein